MGIISHGGGADWALKSYKAMVNDAIANALDTIQCCVIAHNDEWDTIISIPVSKVEQGEDIFPLQSYDWDAIEAEEFETGGGIANASKKCRMRTNYDRNRTSYYMDFLLYCAERVSGADLRQKKMIYSKIKGAVSFTAHSA